MKKNPRNHDHGRTCNYFFLRKVFLYWEGYFFGNNLKNMFRRNERFEFRHFLATRVYRDLEREGWAFQTAPSIWGVSDPSFIFFQFISSSIFLSQFAANLATLKVSVWQLFFLFFTSGKTWSPTQVNMQLLADFACVTTLKMCIFFQVNHFSEKCLPFVLSKKSLNKRKLNDLVVVDSHRWI